MEQRRVSLKPQDKYYDIQENHSEHSIGCMNEKLSLKDVCEWNNKIIKIKFMLTLEFPNKLHKDQYLEMIKEWGEYEKIPTDPDNLFVGANYEDFLQITRDARDNPPEGRVSASLFFIIDSTRNRMLGAIDIRHNIDHDFLREIGGHIGYGIRPSERRK